MTESEVMCEIESEIDADNYQTFKLYECPDSFDRIWFYRSVAKELEYIMMSPRLIVRCEDCNPLGMNILFNQQFYMLLHHKRSIELFLLEKDKLATFHHFFGVSTGEFFQQIADTSSD